MIASRLIELESRQPGILRIRINPRTTSYVADKLKEMGFKKPFMQKADQFIVDCALSYHKALVYVLEMSLLSGPNSRGGEFDCWYSNGEYAGWQGLFQLRDFESLAKNRIFAVINVSAAYASIHDLFEPIPNQG